MSTFSETFPNRPSLPNENQDEKIHTIVIVKEGSLPDLLNRIKKNYDSVEIKRTYNIVFEGFSVIGKRSDIHSLILEPEVKHGSTVSTYKTTIDESVPFIGGDRLWRVFDDKGRRVTGKGVKVGVIDTGIDYTHPDLIKNYRGGHDLVDGDDDPMETMGDSNQKTMHGTHVAGIIAANGRVKGVAPDAEIIAYRALGPGGVGTSEQVIAAIEQAIKDNVDIINLSLGSSVNGPDWPTSLALDKAVEKGIIAVTSSGNSGPNIWTVGSPGTSSKAISVGATTPPLEIPFLTYGMEEKQINLNPLLGAREWSFKRPVEITSAGIGYENQFNDVQGKVVLIERGEITFTQKAMNARNAGAIGVIIFNNEQGNFEGSLEVELDIPVVSISKEDGTWLLQKIVEKNGKIRTLSKQQQDLVASFSSRGPVTETWEIKPDVVAPGVAIDSTVPNGYMSMQGTSMAAPHVAGACALIKQVHPTWTPTQIKAALMNTAKKLTDEDGITYNTNEQGAGRIQIEEAIHTETLIYPSSLPFGLVFHQQARTKREVKVEVENIGRKEKKFSFEIPKNRKGVQFSVPNSFYLKPNEKKTVVISVDISPKHIRPGLHDGWLKVYEGSKAIELPYMFAIDEPNYPRVMGFQFTRTDQPGLYKYEVYLPGGAEEFGIALYDPDTLRFIKFLDWKKNVSRGLIEKEVTEEDIGLKGVYKVLVFAKKAGKEDTIETEIVVDEGHG
ncbi:S8 family serine peptidase [Bacillus timonensis]|nr:S8 family serine peptidase [Bacillus timonensis]